MSQPITFPIAINVALIPEKEVYEQCMEISQWLVEKHDSSYQLGPDGQPHITLFQTCIEDNAQFDALVEAIGRWLESAQLPVLQSNGLEQLGLLNAVWWGIERNEALAHWHEQLFHLNQGIGHQEATAGMFIHPEKLRGQREIDWLRKYAVQASLENFRPHFTLGYGAMPKGIELPKCFSPASLGIFWMGPYCSCYQLLKYWNLKTQ